MALAWTGDLNLGWDAADFELPGTDGADHRLTREKGPAGTVVLFICNHCPYVKALLDQIVQDARELAPLGVTMLAVMPNDTDAYPEDGFERMRELAAAKGFPFPYLLDATQSVARAYQAVCTPDVFGFDRDLKLRYRGRITELRHLAPVPDARRELFEAMREIAATGAGPVDQIPSMGCSIKWRDG